MKDGELGTRHRVIRHRRNWLLRVAALPKYIFPSDHLNVANADVIEEKYLLCHRAGHVSAATHWGFDFPTTVVAWTPGDLDRRSIILGEGAVHQRHITFRT